MSPTSRRAEHLTVSLYGWVRSTFPVQSRPIINFTYKPSKDFASMKTPLCTVKRVCITRLFTTRESCWQACWGVGGKASTCTSSLHPCLQNPSSHIKWQSDLVYQLWIFSLKISEGTCGNDVPNNHQNSSNPIESPRFYLTAVMKPSAWSQLPIVQRCSIKWIGYYKTHYSNWLWDSRKRWQTLQAQKMNFRREYKSPMTAAPTYVLYRHHAFPGQPVWHLSFEKIKKPEYTSCHFKCICCV